ncbi:hypothetical protein LCGC14_1853040 [marine sediment metagenome]|uniref:N-acetyltransferase domain-containing protein n=1 Tax=marine sediment metagenome TaxID=412755 RepID=A0A0F9GA53_9ZZZZ
MKYFIIKEPENNEILDCIKVFLISFDKPDFKEIEEERRVWLYLINNNIARFLIAAKNEKIIGIGGLFLFQQVANIGYMGVLPEYRSRGVGSGIFKKLVEKALHLKYKTIILHASKFGEPIYKKFGFQGSYYVNSYFLPKSVPNIETKYKEVKEIKLLPDWLLKLDRETMGFNRSNYLKARIALGAKILVIENEGYALISKILSRVRLGPLIATNLGTALQLIKRSIPLGAEHIIIPKHPFLQNEILTSIPLTESDNPNLKMTYGKKISSKLEYLYAIGTYGKG